MTSIDKELEFAQGEYADNLDRHLAYQCRSKIISALNEYNSKKRDAEHVRQMIDWGNKHKRPDIDKKIEDELTISKEAFLKATGTVLRGLKF